MLAFRRFGTTRLIIIRRPITVITIHEDTPQRLADCGNTRLTPQITQHAHSSTEQFSSRNLLCLCAVSVLLWCHLGCFSTLLERLST